MPRYAAISDTVMSPYSSARASRWRISNTGTSLMGHHHDIDHLGVNHHLLQSVHLIPALHPVDRRAVVALAEQLHGALHRAGDHEHPDVALVPLVGHPLMRSLDFPHVDAVIRVP